MSRPFRVAVFCCLAACGWVVRGAAAPSLDPNTGLVSGATQVVPQPDGKLVIVYPGTPSGESLVRLNPDGSTDSGFDASGIVVDTLASIALLPSGRLLLAGAIATQPGAAVQDQLAELKSDGSLDTAFNAGAIAGPSPLVQADGRILVLGRALNGAGAPYPTLTRLEADGSVDASYVPGVFFLAGASYHLYLQPDGLVLVAGEEGAGVGQANLVRLEADGTLDRRFRADYAVASAAGISALAIAADGTLAVAAYTGEDDDACTVNRLLADGAADPAFHGPVVCDGSVDHLAFLPDGQILLSGAFATVNGIQRGGFARLNADGSLDPRFAPLEGAAGTFQGFAVTLGGGFTYAVAQSAAQANAAAPVVTVLRQGGGSGAAAERISGCSACVLVPDAADTGVYIQAEVATASEGGMGRAHFSPPASDAGAAFVTLQATRPTIHSGGTRDGRLLLTRTGDLSTPLTVAYVIGGSALPGRDYVPLRGYRTFAAGHAQARIRVQPMGNAFGLVRGGQATVQVTLVPAATSGASTSPQAQVQIVNASGTPGQ